MLQNNKYNLLYQVLITCTTFIYKNSLAICTFSMPIHRMIPMKILTCSLDYSSTVCLGKISSYRLCISTHPLFDMVQPTLVHVSVVNNTWHGSNRHIAAEENAYKSKIDTTHTTKLLNCMPSPSTYE